MVSPADALIVPGGPLQDGGRVTQLASGYQRAAEVTLRGHSVGVNFPEGADLELQNPLEPRQGLAWLPGRDVGVS